MKYEDKLLKQKIDSMNQNDRIEFYIRHGFGYVVSILFSVVSVTLVWSSFIIFLIGVFLREFKSETLQELGGVSIGFAIVGALASFGLTVLGFFIDKKTAQKSEEFIEKRSKNK